MKQLFLVLFVLVVAGCQPATQPQPIVIQPQGDSVPAPVAPKVETPPPPVVIRSYSYITGYNDGYYGGWLAPGRWTFSGDYRNGWSAGHYDRKHGLPNKHPKFSL